MKYVGENALKKWTSLVKSDIKKKLDKNQGTANSGKILGVDASGEVAPTDTEVATLVDVPNGIVKGDGNTLSAAVAGTDYMVPPTGGTTGQVLTKTADGQEWQDREKSMFIVTISGVYGQAFTADKTFLEIQEAYDAGKVCFALYTENVLPLIAFDREIGVGFGQRMGRGLFYSFLIGVDDTITLNVYEAQNKITASGLLKGDGKGGVSAATAGTDYMAPPTGGTTGQVLTKTADGQEWQDREKDLFVVTISGDDSSGYTADKTFVEIKAAYDEGKTVVATTVVNNSMTCPLFLVYLADTLVQFTAALFDDASATLSITMDKNNNIARNLTSNQAVITASGLLKGDGIGGVSAAVAGTDYVTPDGMNSAVADAKPFIVTFTYNGEYHADKTFAEIKAAYDEGKMCYASFLGNICLRGVITNSYVTFIAFNVQGSSESIVTSMGFVRIYSDNSIVVNGIQHQPFITATGLLKGDGNGSVTAAVAGTDYVTPSDMTSAIQSAIQNTWEASY